MKVHAIEWCIDFVGGNPLPIQLLSAPLSYTYLLQGDLFSKVGGGKHNEIYDGWNCHQLISLARISNQTTDGY